MDKYLSLYKNLPNLTEVIVYAADGIFKLANNGLDYFIRHNHQEVFTDFNGNERGVSYEIFKQVRNDLIKRINDILRARNFDQIFQIVKVGLKNHVWVGPQAHLRNSRSGHIDLIFTGQQLKILIQKLLLQLKQTQPDGIDWCR